MTEAATCAAPPHDVAEPAAAGIEIAVGLAPGAETLPAGLPRGALGAWWGQALRGLVQWRLPDWALLPLTPWVAAVLLLLPVAGGVLLERLYLPGDARFYRPALASGWLTPLLGLWACWLAVPGRRSESVQHGEAPGPGALFAMVQAQTWWALLAASLLVLPVARDEALMASELGRTLGWALWAVPSLWLLLGCSRLLWRCGTARPAGRALALALLWLGLPLHWVLQAPNHWYPLPKAIDGAAESRMLRLSQTVLEQQAALLPARLQALAGPTAGEVGVYAITFAPYASEDVFRQEIGVVDTLMRQRFGAQGKAVQLLNHRDTATLLPWATPQNLQRTIAHMARRMNRDTDVLFIHLSSHGARNGHLASEFWPIEVDALTPQQLRSWLDEAGIRHRVISVSACYAGSWIDPLAEPGTLVMTAADAEHTSYGCGRGSSMTYFGRAMYAEQLQRTWSFEAAHAAARIDIEQREKAAGKTDGYSNPQIRMGEAIRPVLARLAQQQASRAR